MRLKHYAYATPLILLPTTIPDYNLKIDYALEPGKDIPQEPVAVDLCYE